MEQVMIDWIFPILMIGHFVSDFMLQNRWMGENKGKSLKVLTLHVLIYSFSMTIFCVLSQLIVWGHWSYSYDYIDIVNGFYFGSALTIFFSFFIPHFITDFITSKLSGYCYLKYLELKDTNDKKSQKYMYWFWNVIGFDQLIHIISIYWVYSQLMLNKVNLLMSVYV